MNTQFLRLLSLSAVVAVLTLAGCSSDDPAGPDPVPDSTIDAILAAAGSVPTLGDARDDSVDSENDLQGDYRYTYETHDAIENLENVTCLGLNDDVIWPGSLVRGDLAYNYVYEPIVVAAGADHAVDLARGRRQRRRPRRGRRRTRRSSTVRQGISNLVGRALASNTHRAGAGRLLVPAGAQRLADEPVRGRRHRLRRGRPEHQLRLEHVVDAPRRSWPSTRRSTTRSTWTRPPRPSAVLGEDMTEEQIRAAFPAGSQPLYVAGVKYGLMAIMCIETNFTMSQMELALDASYDGVVDVDLGFGYTAERGHELVLDPHHRLRRLDGRHRGADRLRRLHEHHRRPAREFSAASPGVPILYKFRHLRDNTLAMISLTSQYTIVRPMRIRQGVRVTVQPVHLRVVRRRRHLLRRRRRHGHLPVYCNAFNRVGAGDPGVADQSGEPGRSTSGTAATSRCCRRSIFDVGTSIDLTFNTEDYDFNYAKIDVTAWANDHDWASGNENGYGTLSILGNYMFGTKTVTIYNADFTLAFNMTIVLIP